MNVREIAVGGIWTASAIGVAGWTWQAYTQQYQQYPTVGSSGAADSIDWASLLANPALALGQAIGNAVANAIEKTAPAKAVSKAVKTAFAPLPPAVDYPSQTAGKPSGTRVKYPSGKKPPAGTRPGPGK